MLFRISAVAGGAVCADFGAMHLDFDTIEPGYQPWAGTGWPDRLGVRRNSFDGRVSVADSDGGAGISDFDRDLHFGNATDERKCLANVVCFEKFQLLIHIRPYI